MAMKSYIVILTLVAGLTVSSQNLGKNFGFDFLSDFHLFVSFSDRHFYSHEAGQDFDGLEPLHIRLKREDNVAAPAVTTTSTTTPPRSSLNQNSNDNDGADSNSSSDSTSTEQNADDSGGGGMTTTTVSDEDVDDADKSRGHNRPDINIDTFDVKGGDEKINATIKAHITKDHLNRSDVSQFAITRSSIKVNNALAFRITSGTTTPRSRHLMDPGSTWTLGTEPSRVW